MRAEIREVELRYQAAINDRTEADLQRQTLRYLKQQYDESLQRLQALTLVSPVAGQFIIPERTQLSGQILERGDVIAYVVDYQQLELQALISEDDIDAIYQSNANANSISVRFVSDRSHSYQANLVRIEPATNHQLPSAILTPDGGGLIGLDPNAQGELRAYGNYFSAFLSVVDFEPQRFNERVYIRFEHPDEVLIYRWYRSIRGLLLRQLDV
jgi:putative peptide zinc metalloprotease protein